MRTKEEMIKLMTGTLKAAIADDKHGRYSTELHADYFVEEFRLMDHMELVRLCNALGMVLQSDEFIKENLQRSFKLSGVSIDLDRLSGLARSLASEYENE